MHSATSPAPVLADAPWPAIPEGLTLLVPVGSTEQHGPHLPLDTDTVIAVAVAHAAALRLGSGVRVCPAISYGSSGEHQAFPGTVSIGTEALTRVLIEVGRSARNWAPRLAFVNGHGGNVEALTAAVRELREEGTDASWQACRHGDAHAGRGETSLLLHLAPDRVAMERAERGNVDPVADLLPRLRQEGVRPLAPNGVLGDPRGASAAEGAALVERMADELAAALRTPTGRS
ncbi:mycofactocin biosynthesis peptidyl-dipeptidase MftE [Microbacterium sp. HD4P20]|uniref:mycofactocin biosynthesis peptidyl-dipeptidase MftE n=1 Tax=Microbacterium sp. HD4P20 TaxID=2864874 RepID=UPI001C63F19C|nr:mycofactocin biosynthesis peptidyl-dipeptidase MftE [Microbacterium sp. HD4P20]MCP2636312.1 mycofactocin biosynthesis peptidyl-dipeptidase MftE [Microbacterium sp. HD4P20]